MGMYPVKDYSVCKFKPGDIVKILDKTVGRDLKESIYKMKYSVEEPQEVKAVYVDRGKLYYVILGDYFAESDLIRWQDIQLSFKF